MARKIVKSVPLSEIRFDEDFYPRVQTSWRTAHIYSQNILARSNFPPITLALYKGKKYLVDGKHRYEAYKILKRKTIPAEIFTGWDRKRIYVEAVNRNMKHGQSLSPYEKRLIALKLRDMRLSNKEIGKLIGVPQYKLTTFVGERLVSSTTGKEIMDTIVKSGLKHKAGGQYTYEEVKEMQEVGYKLSTTNQLSLINQLIILFKKDLVDLNNKRIHEKVLILKDYIKKIR